MTKNLSNDTLLLFKLSHAHQLMIAHSLIFCVFSKFEILDAKYQSVIKTINFTPPPRKLVFYDKTTLLTFCSLSHFPSFFTSHFFISCLSERPRDLLHFFLSHFPSLSSSHFLKFLTSCLSKKTRNLFFSWKNLLHQNSSIYCLFFHISNFIGNFKPEKELLQLQVEHSFFFNFFFHLKNYGDYYEFQYLMEHSSGSKNKVILPQQHDQLL